LNSKVFKASFRVVVIAFFSLFMAVSSLNSRHSR